MASRFGNRILFILIGSIVITGFLIFLFFYIKHEFTASRTEITETGMVQKITSMGKLELVKYTMKDIVEQKHLIFKSNYPFHVGNPGNLKLINPEQKAAYPFLFCN